MRYVAAYLLAVLGGKESPSGADIEKILGSVGIESEKAKLDKVIHELNGKNIEQLIAEGKGKLASMPSGGGVVASAASGTSAAAPSGGGSAPAAKEETKKVEAKEEESDEDLGFGLFD